MVAKFRAVRVPEGAPSGPQGRPVLAASQRPSTLDRGGLQALSLGMALAIVMVAVPFLRFLLSYLVTLIHELGHTATAWLFAYPAIPAFDFLYGGGFSLQMERSPLLLMGVLALLATGLVYLRSRPSLRTTMIVAIVAYLGFAFTDLHEIAILAMGHGAELAFAGIFLYRAATGAGCKIDQERPLYAMCAWFIVLSGLLLSYRLLTSDEHRLLYEDAKGGGHWMDFSRLAEDFFKVDLSVVAFVFLLATLLTPAVALLVAHHRGKVRSALARLWLADASEA